MILFPLGVHSGATIMFLSLETCLKLAPSISQIYNSLCPLIFPTNANLADDIPFFFVTANIISSAIL